MRQIVHRFATVFRERIGMAPHRYVSLQRVRHAQALLRQGATLASAATESGFCDQSHLCRAIRRRTGLTPRALRGRGCSTAPRASTVLEPQASPSSHFEKAWSSSA